MVAIDDVVNKHTSAPPDPSRLGDTPEAYVSRSTPSNVSHRHGQGERRPTWRSKGTHFVEHLRIGIGVAVDSWRILRVATIFYIFSLVCALKR